MLSPTPSIDRPNLHPGTGYLIGPRVPHGLAAVVEGLTREVLRHRPEDIYVFAAHHFEKLLKLREQYHAEEYSGHEFHGEINLWPTKKSKGIRKSLTRGWSLDKEIEIFEKSKIPADVEESAEDVSTGGEKQETSRQTCSRSSSSTKKASKKSTKNYNTTSDPRATRIISQISALHHSKNILTKDIKQELRKNKLSGEKGKTTDSIEKGIQDERRSRTKVPKSNKTGEEEIERATTHILGRTSTRRPLKKVRRIETESETETEREIAVKTRLENGYERSSVKGDNANREAAIIRSRSQDKRQEVATRFSEHSSERKVSSRALSMDRIRAYVLRKFASTASLEVLRSPTYVEQVQEVIDRAAPIIKEKLEEIKRPRGKRSRSVDLAWNEESFSHYIYDTKKDDDRDEEEESRRKKKTEKKKSSGSDKETDATRTKKTEDSPKLENRSTRKIDETIPNVEREEKKPRRRSVGSGKRSKKHDNNEHNDFSVVDTIDDDSKHNDKSEHELGATHDTLEARLTATQNILEGISMSASELGGVGRIDPASNEPSESEISDNVNVVSLPIVRPPSSRSCRSTAKNGTDSLTLPPISPEAPKSMKKKDDLSLPVLPAASNGNHSASKSQEQDSSRDAEEASTMRDITSDMEDIAVLPENEHEDTIAVEKDPTNDHQQLISEIRFADEEVDEEDKDIDEALAERRTSDISLDRNHEEFDELMKPKEEKIEEIFKDSLNVTPEVIDVPQRPDSLEHEQKGTWNDDVAPVQDNKFDELKDRLIEIEMAERSIENALGGQHAATHYDGVTSEVEKSMTDGKISEAKKLANEAEETVNAVKQTTNDGKLSNKEEKSTNEIEKIKNNVEKPINKTKNSINTVGPSTNEADKIKNTVETLIKDTKNLTTTVEKLASNVGKSMNKQSMNKVEGPKSEIEISKKSKLAKKQAETSTKVTKVASFEKKKSTNKAGESTKEMSKKSNGIEELIVKRHVEDVHSMSSSSTLQKKDDQIIEATVCETVDNDDVTASKSKAKVANELSKTTATEKAATHNQKKNSKIDLLDENSTSGTKAQKRRETDKLVTTPLSLKIPFSYVLSEGSPCEIPDTVTTVIIPDRQCPSPVTSEIELESVSPPIKKEESTVHRDIAEDISMDEMQEHDVQRGYGMEAFGEYIRPESTVLSIDIDFMQGLKGAKPGQDIIISHKNLDNIKEEGDEEKEEEEKEEEKKEEAEKEEEKENDERAEEGSREKKDNLRTVAQNQEKKIAMLENIVEHEENEETDAKTIITRSKDAQEILSVRVPEDDSLPDNVELIANADLTDEGKADVVAELRSVLNSSEESGSSQDSRTITSSDVKESNRSFESPSIDRPVVPELNLDSLQDNTVSSFKMTANGTVTKESNGSLRESDATMSLVEPLTPDERLTIENRLTDREEQALIEELRESLSRGLQSEVSEADQLYRAEHAEYEWLEKDILSTELDLDNKAKSQEDASIALLDDNIVRADSISREKDQEEEELGSEEEIARELIGSLDEEIQLLSKHLDLKEKSKDNGGSAENRLDGGDKSSQPLSESMRSISLDELGKKEISSKEIETLDGKRITKTDIISELLDHGADISQENENRNSAITDRGETKELKLEVEGKEHVETKVAPLAQFEQDELLEQNGKQEIADEKIAENKPDINNLIFIDNQERAEDKQTSISEILTSKNNESMNKEVKELDEKQKENKQDKSINQKECVQEKLDAQNEHKQEKSKIQEEDQENMKLQKEVNELEVIKKLVVPLEATPQTTESRKGSIKDSGDDKDDMKHDKTTDFVKSIIHDDLDTDNQTEKDVKSEKEEKIKNLSTEIESVHGPITSVISEQSIEDHSYSRYWTMGTKSSTVETVIEAVGSNASTETLGDAPESNQDESISRKKDNFYSAVVKVQAYVRGFLTRHQMQINERSKPVSDGNNIPSSQEIITGDYLKVPERPTLRENRHRLRREEALRKTTLSLENAFATSRLQHTGEFHDSVPLMLFDVTDDEDNSIPSDESLSRKTEQDVEQKKPDIIESNTNEKDFGQSAGDDEHRGNFQKDVSFTDHSAFPIVMHLLGDSSRNNYFGVNRNSDSDFNPGVVEEAKHMEPTVDILMLGYPKDDATLQNRYLNFITSVEDADSNMDSLPLGEAIKSSKNVDDAHPSITSGEGSLREPLALPGTSQGVVIEELTSLDEADGNVSMRSDSTRMSTAPKTSLDTNNSVPPEERALEDEKNDLGTSPRTRSAGKGDVIENRKNANGKNEKQTAKMPDEATSCNGSVAGFLREDVSKQSNDISRGSKEHVDEGKNEKT